MRTRYGRWTAVGELTMIVVTLIYASPLYIALVSSLKSERRLFQSPLGLPSPIEFGNYSEAWKGAAMGPAFVTTTLILVVSLLGLVILGSLAAYTIVRRTRQFSTIAYYGFLIGLFIPPLLTIIPLYSTLLQANLVGKYWSLIIVYVGGQMPLTVFLFAGFMRSLSPTYEEAAMIDGASTWQIYTRIVLPLIRPAIGTVVILDAVFIWSDFLNPLLYLTEKQTLAVSIHSFVGLYYQQWNLIFAGAVLAALPMVGVFFLLQRYFLRSFAGMVKG